MNRYSKPLSDHVALVEKHATFLLNRLVKYSVKANWLMKKQQDQGQALPGEDVQELYRKMKAIQVELECVEKNIKESCTPEVIELYEALKALPIKEDHEEEV